MVDRQKTLIEFVAAWAEYESRMHNVGSEAKKLAGADPAQQQMIARISETIASSPDLQRRLAMELAIAEFEKSG